MKALKTIIAVLPILAATTSVYAQGEAANTKKDWHFIVGYNLAYNESNQAKVNTKLGSDLSASNLSYQDGFQIWVGRQLTDYLSAELGYISFGKTKANLSGTYISDGELDDKIKTSLDPAGDAWVATLRGDYPLIASIDLYGRLGVARYESDYELNGLNRDFSNTTTDIFVGAGAAWSFRDNWRVDLGWMRGNFDGAHADRVTIDLGYLW
jgi:opacity protein-like surface antigen